MTKGRKKTWEPIPPHEKDFLTAAASTQMLLMYIESLEAAVDYMQDRYLRVEMTVDRLRKECHENNLEIARLRGDRILSPTPDERRMNDVRKRQELKATERERRRKADKAATQARIRNANLAAQRNSRHH